MELVVVLRASEDQEAIAQSRCLGLTGTDIYVYTYVNNINIDISGINTYKTEMVNFVHIKERE